MSYEAVVSSFAERLGDFLIEEAPLLYGVHDSLEWIRKELKSMQSFLKDAESKQKEDARVKDWVKNIREVCYDTEDVIDAFIVSQRGKKRDGFVGRLLKSATFPCGIRPRFKVAKQIEQIRKKIREISSRRETYGIRDINEGRQEPSSSGQSLQGRRRLLSLLEETEVVGQQEGFNTVKEQLMSDESRRCVISIIGMGGLGKTTLAKKVYHDVKHAFDCHAFVYLSEQFGIKDVLMRILKCVMDLSREEGEKLNVDALGKKLRDHLRDKRYLVVIDDIWSRQAWDILEPVLPTGTSKSRVMLTTRIKDVALHADSSTHPHEMRLLNDDEGWELFKKKMFPEGNPSTAYPAELMETLKETREKILAKCGGLPLAILVVGGLLSQKDKTVWSEVLESVKDLSGSFDQLWRTLALSYWDLPYYLKPCFLYLGLFPGDSEIGSGRLIRLWIAEGFIEKRDNQIMEDVAEDFLEELADRSMIQVASRKSNGYVGKFRLHNLLREFSLSEATQNDFFAIHNDNDGTCSSLTGARRLALYDTGAEYEIHATRLRSLFCFPGSKVPMSKLVKMGGKFLRVLVTEDAEEESFKEVGACVRLRYLELARMIDGSLPSSIGNLSSLQTLKLSFRGTLPNAIWNLEQLRHLSCFYFTTDELPKLKKLRNLQTLKLSAGSWIGDGLGKLSNLRKLGIRGDLGSHHEALLNSIDKLSCLQSLKLYDGHSMPPFESFSSHSVLYEMYLDGRIQKLPMWPQNLTKLTLRRSSLRQDAISTLGKLPHLKILKLLHESYDGKRMICSQEGGFPCLELLTLSELPLECLDVEDGAMKSLKSVELFDVSKLETETLPKRVQSILKQI